MKDLAADPRQTLPRSEGRLQIAMGRDGRLEDLFQKGCLKALFPRNALPEVTLINTSGGIAGGDTLETEISLAGQSKLSVSTQACERVYRSSEDALHGSVTTRLAASGSAELYWMPQETIFYDGGRLKRRLEIDASDDARILAVESILFGRLAMGETSIAGRLTDEVSLRVDGRLVRQDKTRLNGRISEILDRPAVANGHKASALLVFRDPNAHLHAERLVGLQTETSGCSLLAQDLLVARYLAEDGLALRRALIPALTLLSGSSLPRCWRL